PLQHGVRGNLEHPGDGADAQALRQRTHRPHPLLGHYAPAMPGCAVGLLARATTARAMQLAPRSTAGMTVGRDMAQAEPAAIRTVGSGTEMPGGVDLARPSPRGHEAGWRSCGGLRARGGGGLT